MVFPKNWVFIAAWVLWLVGVAGAAAEEPLQIPAHKSWITSIAFPPQNTRIASGGEDQTVRIWDRETGRQLPAVASWASSTAST